MNENFSSKMQWFIQSLERAIEGISSDKFTEQMFQDPRSALFVPDRICELIKQIITSDQEEEILNLHKRLYAIEFFFDEDKIKKIENLGEKYLFNLTKSQNDNNNQTSTILNSDFSNNSNSFIQNRKAKKRKEDIFTFSKILKQQIASLKIGGSNPVNSPLPKKLSYIKNEIQETKKSVFSIQKEFLSQIKRTKKQALKLSQLTFEKFKNEYVEKIKKAKYVIINQKAQIKQLSDQSATAKQESESISYLEQTLENLKEKLQQSEENGANSLDKILSLQQQLLLLNNENAKLEDRNNILEIENQQFNEENNQLNNILNEKQKRIDYLEKSLSSIQNEILETDQMNKINQKVLNLNDAIKRIQDENNSIQKISDMKDQTISTLMNLTNTAKETDMLIKIESLCKVKSKICQLLNRSIHSDVSKVVESIFQTQQALKSIMNISDDSRLVSEIQQLKEEKKKLNKISEKQNFINEILGMANCQNEKQLLVIIPSLQRIKNAFEKVCSEFGIKLDNDINSLNYNLPQAITSISKVKDTVNNVMALLNVKSQDSIKDFISDLLEQRSKISQICEMFHIKNEVNSLFVPIVKLEKAIRNLVKMKESYDIISKYLSNDNSINSSDFDNFDDLKANEVQTNAKSFAEMKLLFNDLHDLLGIETNESSLMINKVKSLLKTKSNYDKIIRLIGANKESSFINNDENDYYEFEKLSSSIHSLLHSKEKSDNIINLLNESKQNQSITNLNYDLSQQEIQSLLNTRERYKELCKILNIPTNDFSYLPNITAEVEEIWKIFIDLCTIFKISPPVPNTATSLTLTHQSLCALAKSHQENQSKSLSSIYNLSIRLNHFKQVSNELSERSNTRSFEGNVTDDLRTIENDLIQIMNDLSNLFVCFGTNDLTKIKLEKNKFDSQKIELKKLTQITKKESVESSINFLSKHFNSLQQSSSFLGRIFRSIRPSQSGSFLSSSFSSFDSISLPISKDTQERLIALADQINNEKGQLKKAVEMTIDKAFTLGFARNESVFSSDLADLISQFDSALKFIVENARHEAEIEFETKKVRLEKRLAGSIENNQQNKDLKKEVASLNAIKNEDSIEIQELRKKLFETQNLLENEKKQKFQLLEAISRKEANTEYFRSTLSADELRLLSRAEKARKFIEEKNKK